MNNFNLLNPSSKQIQQKCLYYGLIFIFSSLSLSGLGAQLMLHRSMVHYQHENIHLEKLISKENRPVLSKMRSQGQKLLALLNLISHALPEKTRLFQISFKEDELLLSGKSERSEYIQQFIEALSAQKHSLKNLELTTPHNHYEFKIRLNS